jgi:uncharacterized Fe-S cluster-containing radical SAM superfamily protein
MNLKKFQRVDANRQTNPALIHERHADGTKWTMQTIDTEAFSATLRKRGVDLSTRRISISRLTGSDQAHDLTEPVNCNGFGRIRHFRLRSFDDWSPNPLPIYPACRALALPLTTVLRAQVFQNSICNWRCWYCFVDFNRLSGDRRYSEFFSASDLVDLFRASNATADVIDLSGGQPDLVPEWILWMMDALEEKGLAEKYFLWSDDNLSNYYFWRYLNDADIARMCRYKMYSRVGCFKGFDELSFQFNTLAAPELFYRQFDIFKRLLGTGLEVYAYVTFTSPSDKDISDGMKRFVDSLQLIHPKLPLRTVPLKVSVFTPTAHRMRPEHNTALSVQVVAHDKWCRELESRFSGKERSLQITEVVLH